MTGQHVHREFQFISKCDLTMEWAPARPQFFELADIARNARRKKPAAISPIALEAVKRIDALFDIERDINGLSQERLAVRCARSVEAWLREECVKLSRSAAVAKPIDYMLKRWSNFARFVEVGSICLTNNAAERALRGLAKTDLLCTPFSTGGKQRFPDRRLWCDTGFRASIRL